MINTRARETMPLLLFFFTLLYDALSGNCNLSICPYKENTMKKSMLALLLTPMLLFPITLHAEGLSITGEDTVQSVLSANQGKRVIVRLVSGGELTGKVGTVNSNVVHLIELSGREFFDAVVSLGQVEAVIIRTRQ